VFYVYILQSEKDKRLYIGFTSNLKQRVQNHNLGLNSSTQYRKPLKLIYYEAYINEKDAREKERFYKSGRGHEVIKNILKNYFFQLSGRPSESEGF